MNMNVSTTMRISWSDSIGHQHEAVVPDIITAVHMVSMIGEYGGAATDSVVVEDAATGVVHQSLSGAAYLEG